MVCTSESWDGAAWRTARPGNARYDKTIILHRYRALKNIHPSSNRSTDHETTGVWHRGHSVVPVCLSFVCGNTNACPTQHTRVRACAI